MGNIREFRNTEYGIESTGHAYVNTYCCKNRRKYFDIEDPEYSKLQLEVCFDTKTGEIDYLHYLALNRAEDDVLDEDDAWDDWTLDDIKALVRRIPEYAKVADILCKKEITLKMVEEGYRKGDIELAENMCGCDGVCCTIGGNAFYFDSDSNMAADTTVEDYKRTHSENQIVQSIYEALKDGIKELDEDEYHYYYLILRESLCAA